MYLPVYLSRSRGADRQLRAIGYTGWLKNSRAVALSSTRCPTGATRLILDKSIWRSHSTFATGGLSVVQKSNGCHPEGASIRWSYTHVSTLMDTCV